MKREEQAVFHAGLSGFAALAVAEEIQREQLRVGLFKPNY